MKMIIAATIVGIAIVAGAILFNPGNSGNNANQSPPTTIPDGKNVSIVDGKQIVEITARGGYWPQRSMAKSGIPTIIRFKTNGSFDCSSSVRIPSLGINKILPQSGNTDIDIGTPQIATLQGTCGMGMYRFQVEFQS